MNKIEIRSLNGDVIFSYEEENNTIKDAVEAAIMQGVSLANANLGYADLSYADLTYANLAKADLRGANLSDADLEGANLSDAILIDANLNFANLAKAEFEDARLCNANLEAANLSVSNFSGANLSGANLAHSVIIDSDLSKCNLSGADLNHADLYKSDLSGANLTRAILRKIDLMGVDLKDVDFTNANIYGVNLEFSKNVPDNIPMACPKEGSFIAWKKITPCRNTPEHLTNKVYLVKLEIPEDAKRSSATSNKCRCDKAKVLEITNIETYEKVKKVTNYNYAICTYKVGEMVYPDSFDEDRWNECSNGIHFFMNKQDAIMY